MLRADPDKACLHENFLASVEVNRLAPEDGAPVHGFSADVRVRCGDCDEPFRWTGLRAGLSMSHPMCSIDEETLIAPIRPASADPDFGMGIPGFSVGVIVGDDDNG